MTFFVNEIVTPPTALPIAVDAADEALAAAVVEEIERTILWRAIVAQRRLIRIDGPLPPRIELEPVTGIVSLVRWTPENDAAVIDAANYNFVSRDPQGTIVAPAPGADWPAPQRAIGSFALTYECGWTVTSAPGKNRAAPDRSNENVALTYMAGGRTTHDAVNEVPAAVRFMIERAVVFRAGSGVGDLSIGSLKIGVAKSYSTDRIPPEIAGIGRAYQYRPGIFAARP